MKRLMVKKQIFVFIFSIALTLHAMETENVCNALHGMKIEEIVGTEKPENVWDMFPADIKTKIFAHLSLEKQEQICTSCPGILLSSDLADKDSCIYFVQNKSDQMIRKWLFARMIRAARSDDIKAFITWMGHAERNKYADILDLMQYFCFSNDEQELLNELRWFKDNISLNNFLPHMIKVFAGSEEVHDKYKKEHADVFGARINLVYKALNRKQPNQVAELLLLQNVQWLNYFELWVLLTLCNNIEMAQFLFSFEELNVNVMNGSCDMTPLFYAVTAEDDNRILRMLLERGANPNLGKMLPLHSAVSYKNLEAIDLLLSCGADINMSEDCNGKTPLIIAVTEGSLSIVKLLVEKGANINHHRESCRTKWSLFKYAIMTTLEGQLKETDAITYFLCTHPTFVCYEEDKELLADYLEKRQGEK